MIPAITITTVTIYAATFHAVTTGARLGTRRSTMALIRMSAATIKRAELDLPWP